MIFARFKQFATTTALAVSIALSVGMSMPAAAMAATPMDGMAHEATNVRDCLNQHYVAPGTGQKIATDEIKDEDNEPKPKSLPYFVQFQKAHVEEKQLSPEDIVRSSSFRPPDIIRLTANIRF